MLPQGVRRHIIWCATRNILASASAIAFAFATSSSPAHALGPIYFLLCFVEHKDSCWVPDRVYAYTELSTLLE